MKENLTDINVVLDRSWSMFKILTATIDGFNEFLNGQKAIDGEAYLTLAQFDDQYEIVHNGVNIHDVPELTPLTFQPRGMTALYDAIGKTILATGQRLEAMKEEDRPSKVIFVITTDGEENASKEFDADKIKEMIEHQTNVYNWDFVFIGANQDAVTTAKDMGILSKNAMTYAANDAGATATFSAMNNNMTMYRCAGVSLKADSTDAFFNQSDIDQQKQAGA